MRKKITLQSRFFILSILVILGFSAQSQNIIKLDEAESIKSKDFSILPNKSYTFQQILTDKSLKFKHTDTLATNVTDAYWIKLKVHNPFAYSEKYMVEFLPMADNTLYYFNKNQQKWLSYSNGLMVNNRQRNIWLMPCVLPANETVELYIKANIESFRKATAPIQATVWLEKESYITENEQFIDLATWITVFVFVFFLIYNAYIFYVFRDKTFIYYLVAQIGGIIFILADQFYFNVLLPFRFCVVDAQPNGFVMFHEINGVMFDIGVSMILFGYVQITRLYFDTTNNLPKQDLVLKYLPFGFIAIVIISNVLLFSRIIKAGKLPNLLPNFVIFSTIVCIFYVAILSFRRKHKLARYFLVANGISMSIILVSSFLYLFVDVVRTTDHAIFAKVAIIAQALFLAIALVQRVLLIREELKQKQLETQELVFQNTLQQAQNQYLQEKLEANQRELASNTLYISQKNELLLDLKSSVQHLGENLPDTSQKVIKNIKAVIQNNLHLESDWERFRIHFEQVHPNFFKQLQITHPTLTQYEIRLCAYFHLNLSTKEIANLLNIDPASVRKAKMRLNKKMQVQEN
ncbi:7TM diverse intracellular signaling domain-containing protein [Emticicia aquatilis]|uniref:7TM diverse intracellular signaling domain-containing protein n=1 Tax=Emticicia aquatilis TaxID=1537369 RepID=UPI001667544A|nr:7TM diverse intracellular signaling domain-containing protein [Emticicia aquatilis]